MSQAYKRRGGRRSPGTSYERAPATLAFADSAGAAPHHLAVLRIELDEAFGLCPRYVVPRSRKRAALWWGRGEAAGGKSTARRHGVARMWSRHKEVSALLISSDADRVE